MLRRQKNEANSSVYLSSRLREAEPERVFIKITNKGTSSQPVESLDKEGEKLYNNDFSLHLVQQGCDELQRLKIKRRVSPYVFQRTVTMICNMRCTKSWTEKSTQGNWVGFYNALTTTETYFVYSAPPKFSPPIMWWGNNVSRWLSSCWTLRFFSLQQDVSNNSSQDTKSTTFASRK